jgi:hypothetical protein
LTTPSEESPKTGSNPSSLSLREARCGFSLALAYLIIYANARGYQIAIDEVRDAITKKDPTTDHMKGSLHELGLAADLNLYLDGLWLPETADHKFLGEHWEEIGLHLGLPLCWGGRFNDGNHYSLAWNGRK